MQDSLQRRQRPRRHGFTLLEVLIVLAILVAVALWSWPALRRQLGTNELRDAAKLVRTELARARHTAVETGTVQHFRFQPGTGRFEIKAAAPVEIHLQPPPDLVLEVDDVGSDQVEEPNDPVRLDAQQQELPDRIRFVSVQTPDTAPPHDPHEDQADRSVAPADENSTLASLADTLPGNDRWSRPIVFYPNGRTSPARIRLANSDGVQLDVILRGLTGVAMLGQVRHNQPDEVHR